MGIIGDQKTVDKLMIVNRYHIRRTPGLTATPLRPNRHNRKAQQCYQRKNAKTNQLLDPKLYLPGL